MPNSKMTVVAVHGAWAECASWTEIILPLQKQGLGVACAPLPLTSLGDDIGALDRVLARIGGDIVLVGHAYAGAVIGATKNERVKLLVYVAALAPDEGETVADMFYREPPHAQAPKLAPDENGFIWMPPEGFENAFAQDAAPGVKSVLLATQRPIHVKCIQEKAPQPLWKDKTGLVPYRRERSNDSREDAAFPSRAHEGRGARPCCRSCADADRSEDGP